MKWENTKRRKNNTEIHLHFYWTVENFLSPNGCKGDYNIIDHATFQKRFNNNEQMTQFKANELFYEAPRYDWCLIQFDENDI